MHKQNHYPIIVRASLQLFPSANTHEVHKTLLPYQPGYPIDHISLLGVSMCQYVDLMIK